MKYTIRLNHVNYFIFTFSLYIIFFFLLYHVSEQVVPISNCDFALPPILKVKKSLMLNPTY